MSLNKRFLGHFAALFTILIWGATFISTKVLLIDFKPVEILICRFILGFIALFLICPKSLKNLSRKEELLFAVAGLLGICLYYLLENIALVFTMASNCGVIMSSTPFITAILSKIFLKSKEKTGLNFIIGFFIAIAGIALICFNGAKFKLNPLGDILALGAAFTWGFYSIVSKKIGALNYPLIPAVRRTFFYGILFMIPIFCLAEARVDFSLIIKPKNFFNLLFLGLGASAACFVSWNYAFKALGVVKTSVYIYLIPVITVLASALILKEPFTFFTLAGTILTILGLFISKYNKKP